LKDESLSYIQTHEIKNFTANVTTNNLFVASYVTFDVMGKDPETMTEQADFHRHGYGLDKSYASATELLDDAADRVWEGKSENQHILPIYLRKT
jgi:hypothetical protein